MQDLQKIREHPRGDLRIGDVFWRGDLPFHPFEDPEIAIDAEIRAPSKLQDRHVQGKPVETREPVQFLREKDGGGSSPWNPESQPIAKAKDGVVRPGGYEAPDRQAGPAWNLVRQKLPDRDFVQENIVIMHDLRIGCPRDDKITTEHRSAEGRKPMLMTRSGRQARLGDASVGRSI